MPLWATAPRAPRTSACQESQGTKPAPINRFTSSSCTSARACAARTNSSADVGRCDTLARAVRSATCALQKTPLPATIARNARSCDVSNESQRCNCSDDVELFFGPKLCRLPICPLFSEFKISKAGFRSFASALEP